MTNSFSNQCRGSRLHESVYEFKCEPLDIYAYLSDDFCLLPPKGSNVPIQLNNERLQFTLTNDTIEMFKDEWICYYINHPICPIKEDRLGTIDLITKTMKMLESINSQHHSLASQQLMNEGVTQNPRPAYQILSNLLGFLHPSQRVFTEMILLNIPQASALLKNKLSSLGYWKKGSLAETDDVEVTVEDCISSAVTIKDVYIQSYRYYFEITVPKSTEWKIGFISSQLADEVKVNQDIQDGMIVSSKGTLIYQNEEYRQASHSTFLKS